MQTNFHFALTTFSAAKVEEITGLPQATQRDWRRRGFLPPVHGKAKHTVFDLTRMMLLAKLSDEMEMQVASAAAKLASPTVASEVLRSTTSIAGLPEGCSSQTLHLEICAYFGQEVRQEQFLVIWSGGIYLSFEEDLSAAFAGKPKTIFGPEANMSDPIGRMLSGKGGVFDHDHIKTATTEELVCLLQYGRVSVLNLRQFGGDLIPNLFPCSLIKRPLVTATPKEAAP